MVANREVWADSWAEEWSEEEGEEEEEELGQKSNNPNVKGREKATQSYWSPPKNPRFPMFQKVHKQNMIEQRGHDIEDPDLEIDIPGPKQIRKVIPAWP